MEAIVPPLQCLSCSRWTPIALNRLDLSSSSSLSANFRSFRYTGCQRIHRSVVHITAAAKKSKPPPKPASRNAIIAAIIAPLLLAGGAVLTGKLLLRKLEEDAMEEAKEWEKRFDPQRLLTDGRKADDESTEKRKPDEDVATIGTRNRPKRVE